LHPRLFFDASELPALRDQCQTGVGSRVLAGMRRRLRPVIAAANADPDLPGTLARLEVELHTVGAAPLRDLPEIAMLAAIDQDADASAAALRILDACPDAQTRAPHDRLRISFVCGGNVAFAYDLMATTMTAAARGRFCVWAVDQGVHGVLASLPANYPLVAGANIPIAGLTSALLTMLAIAEDPGVPSFAATRARALQWYEASLHAAIGPDGYPEEDMGYGTLNIARLVWAGEALQRAGWLDVHGRCPRYCAAGRALLHFVQPWGEYLSTTGDHGDDFGGREFVLARLAAATNDPALLWLLGTLHNDYGALMSPDGTSSHSREVRVSRHVQMPGTAFSLLAADAMHDARHPRDTDVPTSFLDRGRGIVSFRSGWESTATLLVVDGSQRSPASPGHAHASCGHFSLSALGDYFAVDSGRYNIEQNCHNVVLIDGRSGRDTGGKWMAAPHHGLLTGYRPGTFADSANVDSSHQHNCIWARRTVGLVKGRHMPAYAWVVDDTNAADDWAEYHWQLHSSPENSINIEGSRATITGWRRGNHLDIAFILPAAEHFPRPHALLGLAVDTATPSAHAYVKAPESRVARFVRPAAQLHYATFARPRLTARVAGWNGRFLSLLLPRRQGQRSAEITSLPTVPGALAVRIRTATVEDTLVFAFDHSLLEAGPVHGRGHWCVVRRSRRSGRVLAWELADGTALSVESRPLL
jgi:hypothetical protein